MTDRMPWATYLWPGLPQLWREGTWSALAMAVGFAALVNLALAATLLWSELLSPGLRNSAWIAVAVFWGGSAMFSFRSVRRAPVRRNADSEAGSLAQAVGHYLKGDWFETERTLGGLLRRDPRDVDAGLMLATLMRHMGRIDEASRQLDRLERFEGSQKWELEVRSERARLEEATRRRRDQSAEQALLDSPDEIIDAA